MKLSRDEIGSLKPLIAVELGFLLSAKWLLDNHSLLFFWLFLSVTLSLAAVCGFRICKQGALQLRTCGYAGGVIAIAYAIYAICNFLYEMIVGPSFVLFDIVKALIFMGASLFIIYLLCFLAGVLGGMFGKRRTFG